MNIIGLTVYFVSILVVTPVLEKGTGWMQHTKSFPTKEICQQEITNKGAAIVAGLGKHFGPVPLYIKDIECLTYNETVQRNTDLGYQKKKEKNLGI